MSGLAPAVAVDVSGVEKGRPGPDGRLEDAEGVLLLHLAPVRPELPAAETHDTHLSAGPAERTRLHGRPA